MSESLKLRGKRVRLRTMVEEDREALVDIRSTEEVRRRWKGDDLNAEFSEDLADEEVVRLTIEGQERRIIGLVQFWEEDDPDYRHASIDIYLDPAVHRQGLATETLQVLIAHLFDDRGHHRLTIDPVADNVPAINCYAGVGFQQVGVMRAYERQADGSWADGLLMELLASDR